MTKKGFKELVDLVVKKMPDHNFVLIVHDPKNKTTATAHSVNKTGAATLLPKVVAMIKKAEQKAKTGPAAGG